MTPSPARHQGAAPCRWAFVWRTGSESPLIRGFAEAAADAGRAGSHRSITGQDGVDSV